MGNIFGKKSSSKLNANSKVTEQDLAVLQLKQQRDKIKQLQKRVNVQLEKERSVAKELVKNGQKEKALLILRKKKRLESTLEKSELHLEQLEKMVSDIEFSQIQLEVVEGLRIGNESLKQLNQLLNIEDIENLLDETREGAKKQEEISQLLTGGFTEMEEEDLLSELKAMEEDQEVTLPNVPTSEVPTMEDEVPTTEDEVTKEKPRKERRKGEMLPA